MARPLPVNLLMAGTGAVLLISGIGGESLGEVLQGQFGDITGKGQAAPAADSEGGGQMQNASDTEEGAPAASPGSFSSSTFAPSPTSLGRHNPSKQQQAQGIAAILIHKGITHPTNAQIETARQEYERKTGVVEYEQQVQEFYHGLPLV